MELKRGFGVCLMFFSIMTFVMYSFLDVPVLLESFHWEGVFNIITALAIFFILGFLPGLFYYKLKSTKSKLINWSIGLEILGIIIVIPLIFLFSMCLITESAKYCDAFMFPTYVVLFGAPFIIFYSIGILLLVIYWFKNR